MIAADRGRFRQAADEAQRAGVLGMAAEAMERELICQINYKHRMPVRRCIIDPRTNSLHSGDLAKVLAHLLQRPIYDLTVDVRLDPQNDFMPNHEFVRYLPLKSIEQ